jgi:hypothetical protein
MGRTRLAVVVGFIAVLAFGASRGLWSAPVAATIPDRLSNAEFWKLTQDLSEPNGSFRSENLISNEMVLAQLIPAVTALKPGGVYLGVGPEQNFSYFAVMKPKIAFITDIRRGNLHVLLMYKALFELSADRAEFVSRLFTRTRLPGLSVASSVRQIMDAYRDAPQGSEAAFKANLEALKRHLTGTRALPLGADDLEGIEASYRAFYFYGPAINYNATTRLMPIGGIGRSATYYDLMTQSDESGRALSYLASEETFHVVKDLYDRNVIVPLVGDFAGPKTIRAIGEWVRAHGATVTAFYVSTVEHYLRDAGVMSAFCSNVSSLPTDATSVFIRPGNVQQLLQGNALGSGRSRAPLPIATSSIGQYQIGVVVPVAGGCG